MSDDAYLDDLALKIRDFAAEIERAALPQLKSDITRLKDTFGSFLNLLKKKGMVADDPYQFTEKVSEIKSVPNDPFLESQRLTVVSIRLHHFENQLLFLSEYFQFSLDNLTLPHIKSLTVLLRYVRWEAFTENNPETNTKIVAEIVGRVRRGDDSISIGLANDMINQLSQQTAKIFDNLKRITLFKREEYKLLLRSSFWSNLNLAAEEVIGNPDNVMNKIKKQFAAHLRGQVFVQELVKEILEEDFAANGPHLRGEVLQRIAVRKAVQAKAKVESDPRQDLMDAVRTLSTYNIPLDASLRKLQENAALLEIGQDSIMERFRRWIRSLMGVKNKPRVFLIDIVEPATGGTKQERLEFDPFVAEASTRVRILASMTNRTGANFQSLLQKGEDEILSWFERQFIEAAKSVERINGLDLFFKTEVPKERRSQVKGVKAEVAQIRTTMSNANKERHEAVSRREELEQLKRLGIRTT